MASSRAARTGAAGRRAPRAAARGLFGALQLAVASLSWLRIAAVACSISRNAAGR